MSTPPVKIITVTPDQVQQTGFFCFMSKKKAPGYQQKMNWLQQRFTEGLRIKMLELPERGFIEYIPGEYAWRAVHAEGYLFIHCLWVVGKSKGKGFGKILIDACIEDARAAGMAGVAVMTSERVWLAHSKIYLESGFEIVDESPPFKLLVKQFKNASNPSFPKDWTARVQAYPRGLAVFRAGQCPYIEDAVNTVVEAAAEKGIACQQVLLTSAKEVQQQAPSPYGVFSIVHNGQLLSYHYLLKKDLLPLLK